MDELKKKGKRHSDYTRALIKDKLSDKDNEIATTSCKVSLACPLGNENAYKARQIILFSRTDCNLEFPLKFFLKMVLQKELSNNLLYNTIDELLNVKKSETIVWFILYFCLLVFGR